MSQKLTVNLGTRPNDGQICVLVDAL